MLITLEKDVLMRSSMVMENKDLEIVSKIQVMLVHLQMMNSKPESGKLN